MLIIYYGYDFWVEFVSIFIKNVFFVLQKVPYPVEKIVEKVVHVPVIKHIPVEIKGKFTLHSR